jgi:hypothetical protein
MFTAFQIITNPVGWLLSFLTFGVLLTAAGVGLGSAAYFLPSVLSRVRVVLALASVASFGVAGGFYKGRIDCEAKHRLADLQEHVRVLEKTAEINAKVRQVGDAKRRELQAQLDSFDEKVKIHVQKVPVPVPAKGKCDGGAGIGEHHTRGLQSLFR